MNIGYATSPLERLEYDGEHLLELRRRGPWSARPAEGFPDRAEAPSPEPRAAVPRRTGRRDAGRAIPPAGRAPPRGRPFHPFPSCFMRLPRNISYRSSRTVFFHKKRLGILRKDTHRTGRFGLAAIRFAEPRDHFKRRGLARAVAAQHGEKFTLVHRQGQALHHVGQILIVFEPDIVQLNDGLTGGRRADPGASLVKVHEQPRSPPASRGRRVR